MGRSLAAAFAVAALVAGCAKVPGIYVAEKSGAPSAGSTDGPFDAKVYADSVWDSRIVPTITDKAADAKDVLAAIAADAATADKKYGVQSANGATFFIVKGSGPVIEVADPTGAGSLSVDVTGDGKADLGVAIGPAFQGTALRDAVGFITFGQFTNQIDYLKVSSALNDEVRTKVTKGIDAAAVKGKTVTFIGAFQVVDPGHIVLTPVKCEVGA